MREKIIDFAELSDSREMLRAREPNFMVIFIYFILFIFLIGFAWMWFGEIDIVVKATGVVRPSKNVSIVRNIIGGKITDLNYKEGKKVKKGELLFSIDTSTLEEQRNNLKENRNRLKRDIAMLDKLEKSIRQGENLFTNQDIEYYNRYLVFISNYQQLKLDYKQAKKRYMREKDLSLDSTTESRLEDLQSQMVHSELNMRKYWSEALVNIKKEKEAKENQLRQSGSQLEEINKKVDLSHVNAPISGTIQVIQNFNTGDYMTSGIEILRVVPEADSDFNVEIMVQNKDISQLEEGQKIRYRFQALSYKEYGVIEGKLKNISTDAVASKNNSSMIYNAKGTLKETVLYDNKGKPGFVRPGMVCQVRVVVRRKKILYIVLEKLNFLS